MRLKIRRFDPARQMRDGRISLFIGRRGTGKTVLLEDIMYHMRSRWDFGLLFTPTEDTAGMFRKHVPTAWIYSNYSETRLEQMIASQRAISASGKAQRSLFFVTDDCGFDKSSFKSKTTRDIYYNGRHVKISLLSCMQYCLDLPPELRTQVDYVFCLKENIAANKMRLWRSFFGMFEKYEDFSRTLDSLTQSYGCIVLDQTVPTNSIEDCVFWYKANIDLPPFKVGKPVFHQLSDKHGKSESQKRREAAARAVSVFGSSRSAKEIAESKRVTDVRRADRKGRVILEDRPPPGVIVLEK